MWKLKSQALWINQGDANKKKLHRFTSARRNLNTIWELYDSARNLVGNVDQLKLLGEEHFSSLLWMFVKLS